MAEIDTLPKLLLRNYLRYDNQKTAMRRRHFGIWQQYSWRDYYEKVKYFSLGLTSLGLRRGDRVAILSDNVPEWYQAYLATQAFGGIAVGIFIDSTPDEVMHILSHSETKILITNDQEQVDKILEIKDELSNLAKVIYCDAKGLWNYDNPILLDINQVLEMGKEYQQTHPDLFEKNIQQGCGDDIATICYASDIPVASKGSVVSHSNIIHQCKLFAEESDMTDGDEYVSHTSPAWLIEQILGIAGSLYTGMVVNFPEGPATIRNDTREIGPHIFFNRSPVWENLFREIRIKAQDTTRFNRILYTLSLNLGYKMTSYIEKNERPNLFWAAIYRVSDLTISRAIRDKIGLSRCRVCYSVGAPLTPDVSRFFSALGINLGTFRYDGM